MYNATVVFTTGAPGTGKTYSRCARFLWDYWLPETKGVHWSNFPVKLEKFLPKYPDAADRIRFIPKEELDRWANYESGPWEFFKGIDLQDSHVAIDECHNFIRKTGEGCKKNAELWQKWLGEIRHVGCKIEFLSQDPHKVNQCIEIHSAVRIQLINSEDRRDPLFGILLGDWYELRGKFVGLYETTIWQIEERRIAGKWKQSHSEKFTLQPFYFDLYDSFNTPHGGDKKASGQQRQCEKRGWAGLLGWFGRRNAFRIGSRLAIVALFAWACFGGGIQWGVARYIDFSKAMAKSNGMKDVKPAPPVAAPASVASPGSATAPGGGAMKPPAIIPALAPVAGAPLPAEVPSKPSPGLEGARAYEKYASSLRGGDPLAGPLKPSKEESKFIVGAMGSDFVCMGDGRFVQPGELVHGFTFVKADFAKRVCVFRGVERDASTFVVPVGASIRK